MNYTGNENVDSRATYFEARNNWINKNGMKPELILFGDSITDGFNPSMYGLVNGSILNCGIGGERINTARSRIERDVISFNPTKVLFMLGINDLLHYEEPKPSEVKEKINVMFTEYCQIVNQMQSNQIEVICCSIIKLAEIPYDENKHIFRNYMYLNEIISKLNRLIEAYAKKNNIKYIDYNSVLTNEYEQLNPTFSYDGVHLNELGYFEMFKLLKSTGLL